MDFKETLNLKELYETMRELDLDCSGVSNVENAVSRIVREYQERGEDFDFECDGCGMDIPDVKVCPFCRASLVTGIDREAWGAARKGKGGIPKEFYKGAPRGQPTKGQQKPRGATLFRGLIKELGIPKEFVKHRKSVISLWCHWGVIARVFVGAWSVRFILPFKGEDYNDPNDMIVDFSKEQKGYLSRASLVAASEYKALSDILKQSVLLVKDRYDEIEQETKLRRKAQWNVWVPDEKPKTDKKFRKHKTRQ
jgi:hypothetical protein